jgi:hypothetical protein
MESKIERLVVALATEIARVAATAGPSEDFAKTEEQLADALAEIARLNDRVAEHEADGTFHGAIAGRYRRTLEDVERALKIDDVDKARACIAGVWTWRTSEHEGIPMADIAWFERTRWAMAKLRVLDTVTGDELDKVGAVLAAPRGPFETDAGLRARLYSIIAMARGE